MNTPKATSIFSVIDTLGPSLNSFYLPKSGLNVLNRSHSTRDETLKPVCIYTYRVIRETGNLRIRAQQSL